MYFLLLWNYYIFWTATGGESPHCWDTRENTLNLIIKCCGGEGSSICSPIPRKWRLFSPRATPRVNCYHTLVSLHAQKLHRHYRSHFMISHPAFLLYISAACFSIGGKHGAAIVRSNPVIFVSVMYDVSESSWRLTYVYVRTCTNCRYLLVIFWLVN